MSVSIHNLVTDQPLPDRLQAGLTLAAKLILQEHHLERGAVNIILTGNGDLQKLNRQYRSKDEPTDVLSFSMLDFEGPEDHVGEGEDSFMVGDIYISLDRAGEQALEAGHSRHREILILAIHGLLHLVGYDHHQDDDYEIMRQKEAEVINLVEQSGEGLAG